MRGRGATLAFALVAFGVTGCSAMKRGPASSTADTIVEVENHGFPDIVLYAVASGDPHRLGMVNGNGSAKFKLPPRFTVGSVQLLARPIAGRSYLLPPVTVSAGDVIQVSLENSPAQSSVSVAPR